MIMTISPAVVQSKSDSGSLSSDHIIFAPSSTYPFLACLFTTILKHSFMPLSLQGAIIQPIPKGSNDPSLSANYCGIALACILPQ